MNNFLSTLRELRKNKKMSLKEFGDILGVSESTVSLYETGKRQPDYETLLKIAKYFSVTVDYLLGNNIKETQNETPLSPQKKNLLDAVSNLSDDDIKKVVEYTEFIKQKGSPQ